MRDELLGLPHADEDFLVPGVDQAGLRALLEPHGRVEDMEVHGQLVGVRLFPRDRAVRALAPAGIELTPPRAERSTGPGHRDFAIVSDASIELEEDMARRDFTINAMAMRLDGGDLIDPFGGRRRPRPPRACAPSRPTSFRDDPLRLLRGLRFVSQLGFDLDAGDTGPDATGGAGARPRLGRADRRRDQGRRDGGALEAPARPRAGAGAATRARHRRPHPDDPRVRAAIGYSLAPDRQPLPLEEHLFAVVQSAADGGASLAVRLACLLHDLGKPEADATDAAHAAVGARLAPIALEAAPVSHARPAPRRRIVAGHAFRLDGAIDGLAARRFLAEHGDALALDLVSHKAADLGAKPVPAHELEALARLAGAARARALQPRTA